LERRDQVLVIETARKIAAEFGLACKDCDPYLPENSRPFVDADGTVYIHCGRGRKKVLGQLLREPDGAFWDRLDVLCRAEHVRQFDDYLSRAPSDRTGIHAPEGMGYVPPGVFHMGGTENAREQPIHPVYLDGFFIDRFTVTNLEFAGFLNRSGWCSREARPYIILDSPHCLIERHANAFRAKPGYETYPVVMVTWYGADAYARSRNKRLPTEAEWEKAAQGGVSGRIYAWGNDPPGDQCNWRGYRGVHAGLRPDFYHGRGPLPVGLFDPNPYGLHDLSGNIWEWCSDWYDPEAYTKCLASNPKGPAHGSCKSLRGGSWSFDPSNLRIANRSYAAPDNGYSYDGFRCVVPVIDLLVGETPCPT
jgi:iron(II)-dependent oxidoreductase